MGATYTKFKALEVGTGNVTGKLGKCISPNCVSKVPMNITIKADTWNKVAVGLELTLDASAHGASNSR